MEPATSIEERITEALDRLSPTHKRLAHFVLENRHFMSFAPASQVGEKNNASAATVVRFAQALGYQGFSEFQDVLRTELPSYLTAARRMQQRMSAGQVASSTPQQVFHTDILNIERTAGSLSEESLNAALSLMLNARRILVVGSGVSSVPASFLAYSLKVMGFDARVPTGAILHPVVELANLRPDDLLIAIDLWRYVRQTVNAVRLAGEMGIPVIAITDNRVSPLAQSADVALEAKTASTSHSHSIAAVISLINVFITMLAERAPEQVYQSLQKIDAAYRDNDLLMMR